MKKRLMALLGAGLFVAGCGGAVEKTGTEVQTGTSALAGPLQYRGVNLASAEFSADAWGNGALPGTHGADYIYPDPAYTSYSSDYYIGRGMNTFRVPFRWERLQPTRRAAFDAAELTRLKTTVNRLAGKGMNVLLDPHNYARYRTALIGSSTVPVEDFSDFWWRLANEFKASPNVIFGLMNEPHDMPTEQWVSAANAAIGAIRNTGARNLILVPGNAWTGAHSWNQNWYGTANASAMLQIGDSANNFAFEVHQYLDADSSGTQEGCVSGTIGSERMQGFTNWLRANGRKGFLGEFGGGTSSVCLGAIDNIVSHLEANADVYLGWTYWAGGPRWGNYFTSLEPVNGVDRPQMTALQKHLGSCQPSTYEAESMYHSTGGTTQDGWLIWGNGFISTNHGFTSGATTLTVVAKGAIAAGVWPHMVVTVNGVRVGEATVSVTNWTQYAFRFNASAGTQEIRVVFDNDATTSTEDRNLFVDKVMVGCG
jgi:endoglucanase